MCPLSMELICTRPLTMSNQRQCNFTCIWSIRISFAYLLCAAFTHETKCSHSYLICNGVLSLSVHRSKRNDVYEISLHLKYFIICISKPINISFRSGSISTNLGSFSLLVKRHLTCHMHSFPLPMQVKFIIIRSISLMDTSIIPEMSVLTTH